MDLKGPDLTIDTIPTSHPARRAVIGDMIRRNSVRYPDREAIVVPVGKANPVRRSIAYAELNSKVNRLAHALAAQGIGHGDVVATMGRNCPEWIITFYAALKLGAVVTGVNYTFTSSEIRYQLIHSGAKAVVVEDRFVEKIEALGDPLPALKVRVVNDVYGDTAGASWLRLSTLLVFDDDSEPVAHVQEDDLAILPYTSGTEALPKAIMVPHRNYLVSMIPSYITGIGLLEEDIWYYMLPFHTIAGMGVQIALLSLANTVVLPMESTPAEALAAMTDEKVTVIGQTPTFYLQLIGVPGFKDCDLSGIRRAITYGGTMPQAMFDAFRGVAPGLEWVTLWSQSELTQTPTIGRFRSLSDIPHGDASWIGRPTSQLEVRVVDENDIDVEPGVEGELICRSPGVMLGYLGNPEKTASVIRGGWLHTGDMVRRDEAGNLFFVDRQKDVIKSGGMNVSSVEVERTIYQHGSVLEVGVVGLAHEYWSQAVTAFIVVRPGEEVDPVELIAFCKERLAGFKVPKQVRIVESLPKDTQGKMLKRELRRAAEAEAKAGVESGDTPATES